MFPPFSGYRSFNDVYARINGIYEHDVRLWGCLAKRRGSEGICGRCCGRRRRRAAQRRLRAGVVGVRQQGEQQQRRRCKGCEDVERG